MNLKYIETGLIYIDPADDIHETINAMLETGYNEEFCVSLSMEEDFIYRLMEEGFLVMSADLFYDTPSAGNSYFLLPHLHLIRSVLFFPDLHIKKRVKPLLSNYNLKVNSNFDLVIDKCVQKHGDYWLTPPLVETLKRLNKKAKLISRKEMPARPVSFELYRDGELKAGEAGIMMGRVYTSYTGYHEESNAGTIQMIHMVKWLEEKGFAFLDYGMPLDYKSEMGATNMDQNRFIELFRAAQK